METDKYDEWVHGSPYGHLHLRDLFAAFALAGLMGDAIWAEPAAKMAYQYADAMMAQRETPAPEAQQE